MVAIVIVVLIMIVVGVLILHGVYTGTGEGAFELERNRHLFNELVKFVWLH